MVHQSWIWVNVHVLMGARGVELLVGTDLDVAMHATKYVNARKKYMLGE